MKMLAGLQFYISATVDTQDQVLPNQVYDAFK